MGRTCERIQSRLLGRAWNEKRGAFTAGLGADDLDASVLLLPDIGLSDADDPRFVRTVDAIERELFRDKHVMRYTREDDFGIPESAFLVCRFWLIDAWWDLGRRDEAREMFTDALKYRNRYGLLAEHVHPQTGQLWGNFPSNVFDGRAGADGDAPIAELGGSILAQLVVVSNRVSVPTRRRRQSRGRARSGAAPGASAVTAAFGSDGAARLPPVKIETRTIRNKNVDYVVTDLSADDFQEYYNGFANRVLWPILHYRLDLAEFARRDLGGYMRVNEHFANELSKLIEDDDYIWVHDYHLIPIADLLRRRGHANRIGFFLHVPLPSPEVLMSLPNHEQLIPRLSNMTLWAFRLTAMLAISSAISSRNPIGRREMRVFESLGHQYHLDPGRHRDPDRHFPVGIEPAGIRRLARQTSARRLSKNWWRALVGALWSSVWTGSIIPRA